MSIILNLFLLAFVSINLFTWVYLPQYSQTFTETFLKGKSDTIYTVPLQSFLPTVWVMSASDEGD